MLLLSLCSEQDLESLSARMAPGLSNTYWPFILGNICEEGHYGDQLLKKMHPVADFVRCVMCKDLTTAQARSLYNSNVDYQNWQVGGLLHTVVHLDPNLISQISKDTHKSKAWVKFQRIVENYTLDTSSGNVVDLTYFKNCLSLVMVAGFCVRQWVAGDACSDFPVGSVLKAVFSIPTGGRRPQAEQSRYLALTMMFDQIDAPMGPLMDVLRRGCVVAMWPRYTHHIHR